MRKKNFIELEIPHGYKVVKEPVICWSAEHDLNLYIQVKCELISDNLLTQKEHGKL
jgi:hypothetical protein